MLTDCWTFPRSRSGFLCCLASRVDGGDILQLTQTRASDAAIKTQKHESMLKPCRFQQAQRSLDLA